MVIVTALSLLGFAGNILTIPISFGVSFIFGSIFAIIAVVRFGLWTGGLVAVVASSYTYILWNHPYAIVIFAAEIVWIGTALKRGKSDLLLIDGAYWLLLGFPLVTLFYGGILGVGSQQTIIIILKQSLNGVFNTLTAWIILSILPNSIGFSSLALRKSTPYNQIIFQMAAAFLMVPALGMLLILTRYEISATQEQIIRNMKIESHMMSNAVAQWIALHVNAARIVGELGMRYSLSPSVKLQKELKLIHELFPDFHNIFLGNAAATTIAFDPPINKKGQSTIGINFSDRDWFKELSNSLQPTISDVFTGRGGVFVPIFSISVPVVRDGKLSHFGLGAINLDRMQNVLQQVSDQKNMITTIIDRNNRVIVSTDKLKKPLEPLIQQEGKIVSVGSEVDLWLPDTKEEISNMQVWKNAFFMSRLPITGTPWTMVVEYPVAPMQKHFFHLTILGLSVVAVFFVVMIFLAMLTSRRLTEPILSLADVSKNLPDRIAGQEHIAWPQSSYTELAELIANFQQAAITLDENLTKINKHNLQLEETVMARTLELDKERQHLANIIEGTNIGTWEWNIQSGETIFNERWAEIVGYRLQELQPTNIQTWLELAHPEDIKGSNSLLEKHFSRDLDFYDHECRMHHKEGHWVWVHARGRLISRTPEGQPLIMSGTHEDITEQKNLQARLLTIMEEQDIILENTNVGILMVRARKQVWANKKFQNIFGYSKEEIINTSTRLFYPSQEEYERFSAHAYPVLACGEAYHTETRMRRKDGTDVTISLSGKAVNPANPEAESIWIFENITERIHARLQLEQKTRQLESLTRDLEKKVQEEVALRVKGEQVIIQQTKLAAMGEMLGAISHQWRQPLNALGIIIQNIHDAYTFKELDQQRIDDLVKKSMFQIQHMSKTIDDFRNFFKPDKKKCSFNSMDVVTDVLKMMSAQLATSRISYQLECHTCKKIHKDVAELISSPEMTSFGYVNEFQHVILNIISNAIDAIIARTETGPPELQQIPGQINFDFFHTGPTITIDISDNGCGIDSETITRIFEPYFTTKDSNKGTGLGLYMSKVIMEHMGGRLIVKNNDQGAVFTIELPRWYATREEPTPDKGI